MRKNSKIASSAKVLLLLSLECSEVMNARNALIITNINTTREVRPLLRGCFFGKSGWSLCNFRGSSEQTS